jgi:ABC-type polar amino acid transport system ATPase subunit
VIVVDKLAKRHGAALVLRGISMEVPDRSVEVIIGPSGGGKSTFLRCLVGLEPFHGGSVRIGEDELAPATDERRDAALLLRVRRKVGFVFQQFNLFPHLTVMDNLVEAPLHVLREPRQAAEARALELLERMGLRDKPKAHPRQLSGGQQQRVAIARALMMKPEAILFDEPTSALDPVMASEVLAVMTELASEGQTMIVVTHSMSFARRAATNVHVFADGLDVESGAPEKVFGAPEHATTRAFLERVAG